MHMSNPTGFDYDVMISRLHGGLRAFQSLRAHRRQRAEAAAPPPAPEERPMPEPPRAASVADVDERADLRATASMQPQGFVAFGDRVVPLFGTMNAGLFGAAAGSPLTTPSDPPAPPAVAPAPASPSAAAPAAAPAAETRPPASPATLKLPPPTLPPQLGVLFGGRSSPEPGVVTETGPQAPDAPPPVAMDAASITALLDARAQEDAQRLERAHAEHHAAMASLLCEHREELRIQREADAARTSQLLREALAEHRAELARANQTHAEHLAQVLARETEARAAMGGMDDLRGALLEQAHAQREANEAVAENLDALTSIVAELGHTVGMLAVSATQKAQQAHRPATFSPPPRVEPAPAPPDAAPSRGQGAITVSPHVDVANTEVSSAAAAGPAGPATPATPAAANKPPSASRPAAPVSSPAHSLADSITREPPRARPIAAKLTRDADESARLQDALADDDDDDLSADLASNDDDRPRRRLGPCTDLQNPDTDDQEPGDD